jgi:hypothetical protein
MNTNESPTDVAHWVEHVSAEKWPAILGSLSLRRSPASTGKELDNRWPRPLPGTVPIWDFR